MVVIKEDQDVDFFFFQPRCDRLVAFKQRRPCRIILLSFIVGESDGRHMRCADRANDFSHYISPGTVFWL
ncbi:hypothetical protein D3C81_2078650 [compost metagenome]